MKKLSKTKLKKKAWGLFSEYIRKKYANLDGYAYCVTCPENTPPKPWKKLQAGHFIAGRRNSILFEETNVHPQCYACNCCNHGEILKYRDYMIGRYGVDEINRLRALAETSVTFTVQDYEAMIEQFRYKILELGS